MTKIEYSFLEMKIEVDGCGQPEPSFAACACGS
jgi:hypothetical protein